MDAAELDLFARSVRAAVTGPADALADTGWLDALEVAPREVITTVFTELGRAAAPSDSLGRLLAHTVGTGTAPVLLPALGAWDPPGRLDGDRVVVDGVAPADLGRATVGVATGRGVVALDVPAGELTVTPVDGLDPTAGLARVRGEVGLGDPDSAPPVDWDGAVRLGRLAVAHEILGASRTILDLAREHATERIQFGQPIARFQAVRHRLAEILIAVETAEALLDAAWLDGTDLTAAMAKAAAGRAGRAAAKHGQQVLAGIGFTLEHDFHRPLRRVLLLDEVLGSSRVLTHRLGVDLLASRRLPPLLPL